MPHIGRAVMEIYLPRFSFRPQLEYQPLSGMDRTVLFRVFSAAFADYPIRIRLSYQRFSEMLDSNCFAPGLSAGVFRGRRMVGLVLNGLRPYEGRLTAYDSGTGVLPRFRGRGAAAQMIESVYEPLRQAGAARYLLEVLIRNEPALHLYRRLGFQPTREFLCFRAPRSHPVFASSAPVKETPVPQLLADPRLRRSFDFAPAWQNSPEQVALLPGCRAWTAWSGDEPRGFGVVNTDTGVIHLLAVEPAFRGRGIGSSLMAAMRPAIRTDVLSVLNVDVRCADMLRFLDSHGFARSAGQYEMIKDL